MTKQDMISLAGEVVSFSFPRFHKIIEDCMFDPLENRLVHKSLISGNSDYPLTSIFSISSVSFTIEASTHGMLKTIEVWVNFDITENGESESVQKFTSEKRKLPKPFYVIKSNLKSPDIEDIASEIQGRIDLILRDIVK